MLKKCGEQWNSVGGTMEQCCGTVRVKQWNNDGGTVWWYSGTVLAV